MKRDFKKDYIIHIEGRADSVVISNLVASLFQAVSEIITKENIVEQRHIVTEAYKQDSTTYEIFD